MVLGNREAGQVAHCGQADCYGSVTQTIAILCSRLTCEACITYLACVTIGVCSPGVPDPPQPHPVGARGHHLSARPRSPVILGACPLVTVGPVSGKAEWGTASSWTDPRKTPGVTVRDPGRSRGGASAVAPGPEGCPGFRVTSLRISAPLVGGAPIRNDRRSGTVGQKPGMHLVSWWRRRAVWDWRGHREACPMAGRPPAPRPTAITEPDGMASLATLATYLP